MLDFLIVLSILLFLFIFYLNYKFYNDRKKFRSKLQTLEEFIVKINKQQAIQNNQLQLSDDMRQKLNAINATLSNDIFDLNYELFEVLSKNNLLDQ